MEADRVEARRAYQREVRGLADLVNALASGGATIEQVARTLVKRRNELKAAYRAGDDSRLVALMEARNLAKYGDPIGPDADQLLQRYGDWRAVVAAAARPAAMVDD